MKFLKNFTADGFQNFAARLGLGAGSQHDQSTYGFDFISRDRLKLEAMYRSSWIVGQVVDVVAEDMTREGIDIRGLDDPEDANKIQQKLDDLEIWNELTNVIKWGRLYGGAIAVMLIDGQDTSTPLNINTVGKDQFKGLMVLDRWLVLPTLQDLVSEYGPDFGKPKYYDVIADSLGLSNQRIHHSRIIRFDGVDLPYWQRVAENLWGQSVIERMIDRLTAFDSTTMGVAQLVYKAHLRTYKVKDLRKNIGMGGAALNALVKQIEQIRLWQSNEGLTLMDAEDQFETHSYSFSGLDAVLLQFGQQLSGASQIPLVRLFGQSPTGMNATGESDLSNYYDNINQQQERRMRSGLNKLLQVVSLSVLGKALPESFTFDFASLWQIDDAQKADIASKITDSICKAEEQGLISTQLAMKELKQSSEITGIYSSITDMDIESAEDEVPKPNSDLTTDAEWNESDHPRDENGQFSSGGLGFTPIRAMSSGEGGRSGKPLASAPSELPSSSSISTLGEAEGYWNEHFKGKTYALNVHSRKSPEKGGHEPITIAVKFGDTNHAYTEKPQGASHRNEERVLSQERAQMLDQIIPTIQHPHARLISRGNDLLIAAPLSGRQYTVALVWRDEQKAYTFESAHLKSSKQIEGIRASQYSERRNKNKGPLQK